jgi:hypothetical protein
VNGKCSRRRWLKGRFAVDRISEPLLTAQITFRRLKGGMTDQH